MASSQSKLLQVLRTDHDRSKDHFDAMLMSHRVQRKLFSWMLLFAQEAEQVQKYWHSVLKRLINITNVLCERGLAFRGEDRQQGQLKMETTLVR